MFHKEKHSRNTLIIIIIIIIIVTTIMIFTQQIALHYNHNSNTAHPSLQ